MNEEMTKIVETATEAVNAAVNPYGFKAYLMDTLDCGEVWFTMWPIDETPRNRENEFEAIYYFKANGRKNAGDIGFGVMEADFTDLPADPAKACAIYKKWSAQKTLEQIIAETEAGE